MRIFVSKIRQLYRKKLRKNGSGFSILEMLLAVLILLLATQLVAESMALASRHYIQSTNRSKAQMIASTLSDFVRSELTTASDVVQEGNDISFIDGSGRLGGRCTIKYDGRMIYLENKKSGQKYYPIIGSKGGGQAEYAEGLFVSSFTPNPQETAGDTDSQIIIKYEYKLAVSDKKGNELATGQYVVNVPANKTDD